MSEMKLTRDEAIRLHRELWDWLTRNPDKKKMDWPRWKNFGSMNGYCFFCEWALYQGGTTRSADPYCLNCPAVFTPNGKKPSSFHGCLGGLFNAWDDSQGDLQTRARLAAQIRDIPIKGEALPPKFKVGDRVCCIKKYHDNVEAVDKTGTVIGTDGETISVEFDDHIKGHEGDSGLKTKGKPGHCWCFHGPTSEYLELVKSNSFKVGDHVRVVNYDTSRLIGWGCLSKCGPLDGKTGTVIKLWGTDAYYVEFNERIDGHGDNQQTWIVQQDCLEVIAEKKIPEAPVLKVGDRVQPKDWYREACELPGVIRDVTGDGYFGVEFPKKNKVFPSYFWDNKFPSKAGFGYYYSIAFLDLLPPQNLCPKDKTIFATPTVKYVFKGNKTTCVAVFDGKQYVGVAHCDPADVWDEEVGKSWALGRALKKRDADRAAKDREIPELKRIIATEKHLALIMEYGAMEVARSSMPPEDSYQVLKRWADKAREVLKTDRSLYFDPDEMTFTLFDYPASKVGFKSGAVYSHPDGSRYFLLN